MRLVIVPNHVRDEINRRLDIEIANSPDAEKDREALYLELLNFFDEHGAIPDFSLVKSEAA